MSSKLTVTIGSKQYQLDLSSLTFETLKQQIIELSKEDKQGSTLVKITDADGCDIETDENLQSVVTSDQKTVNAYFQPNESVLSDTDMKDSQLRMQSSDKVVALSLKEHCNRSWRKANVEASKMVQQMINKNEQGLIIVATNTLNWQKKKTDPNSSKTSSNLSSSSFSFIELVNNNNKTNKKQFAEYYMYLIKSELIILEGITIDGNVYAIDCEMQCKENVNITSQLFVTKNSVIDQQSKQSVIPIEWNTKMNCDIPIRLQDLEYKEEESSQQRHFDDSILYSQEHLQLSTNTFGFDHPYVAVSFNMISNCYYNKRNYKKSIELLSKALNIVLNALGVHCRFAAQLNYNFGNTYSQKGLCDIAIGYYQKALEIQLDIPGINYDDISSSYNNLGTAYLTKRELDKAIQYLEKALHIRKENTVHQMSRNIGDSCWNLANVFSQKGETHTACKYYQEAWQIFSATLGEWNFETVLAKKRIKRLNG
ncbi:hypothetical protein RFI_24643 [Reticulomyxa filosa]|uniref:Uncharacterized protein n=1 Tax=Reticulomyxa filosa TaxID=46433 RepID=X6MFD7_RETFI|nr:hypothetical protein RFI_24643 [Reticulomyxa filosa]|eukprot:ETO12733.1 hypothetical protein RFI_24643 [Reticulomyxa filosa]